MCRHCYRILSGVCLPHSETHCPLKQSLYCSNCATYGHTSSYCPTLTLTVQNNPEAIYHTLLSHSLQPPIKKGSTSLKKMIFQLSKQKGKRLVILPS